MLECWQNIQTCRHKYVVISARGRAGTWPKQPISLSAKEPNKRRYGDRRTDKAGGMGEGGGAKGKIHRPVMFIFTFFASFPI